MQGLEAELCLLSGFEFYSKWGLGFNSKLTLPAPQLGVIPLLGVVTIVVKKGIKAEINNFNFLIILGNVGATSGAACGPGLENSL